MKVTFKVEGLKALAQALAELSDEIGPRKGRTVLRQALQDVAKPIAEAARAKAPEADAPYTVTRGKGARSRRVLVKPGGLKRSIKVGGVLNKSQRAKHQKLSDIEVYIGPSGSTKGLVEEFGSINHSPRPYLRPAWEENKDAALSRFKTVMWGRIQKAAARAAKRRAKG